MLNIIIFIRKTKVYFELPAISESNLTLVKLKSRLNYEQESHKNLINTLGYLFCISFF